MTKTRQQYYSKMYIPGRHRENNINVFLGVAFEIEKPIVKVFKSFYGVLTSPVEPKFRSQLIDRR